MNRTIRGIAFAALSLSAGIGLSQVLPAYAQEAPPPKTKAPPVRKEVNDPLNAAIKAINAKDFDAALPNIQKADAVQKKTPFEEYRVAQVTGYYEQSKPMPDFAAAVAAYDRMIASNSIPDMDKLSTYDVALKLHFQLMDYPKALALVPTRQMLGPLDDTDVIVITQMYYTTMDYANAVIFAKQAVASAQAKGQKPDEDVLALLLNAQGKQGDEAGGKETLDLLATVSAKPEAWGLIINNTLAAFKNPVDDHIINLYRLGIAAGAMTDNDYQVLASLDLTNGLPKEALDVLTKHNVSAELLGQAKEQVPRDQSSLPAFATEAAKTKNGEVDIKLGESYLTYGRTDEAIASIQTGIMKGGLKDAAGAQLLLGVALFTAGKKPEATQAFEQAAMATNSAAAVAHDWLLFMKRSA